MNQTKKNIPFACEFEHENRLHQLVEYGRNDLDAINDLEQGADPYPWPKMHFESSLNNGHYCLGLRLHSVKQKDNPQWLAHAVISVAADQAELLIIAVDKKRQRRGLGKLFLNKIISALETCVDSLFLEVRESNHPAIALYESLGFNQLGMRNAYYPARSGRAENALIYAREFAK